MIARKVQDGTIPEPDRAKFREEEKAAATAAAEESATQEERAIVQRRDKARRQLEIRSAARLLQPARTEEQERQWRLEAQRTMEAVGGDDAHRRAEEERQQRFEREKAERMACGGGATEYYLNPTRSTLLR